MQGGGVVKGPSGDSSGRAVQNSELRAGASERAADHVPDEHPVDTFATTNHLGAQPRMNPRPSIPARIGSGICAKTPGDEFVGFSWALELIRVFPVQTSFQVDDREPSAIELDVIIVARLGSSTIQPAMKPRSSI